jgi:predicted SprT family Zn-dependent metalloprotease
MKKNRVGQINMEMDEKVYRLRRKVIDLIYEAKALMPTFPRVEVRIVRDNGNTLGQASMISKHISIMEESCSMDTETLRHIVFHELCHTIFGIRHNDKCKLMAPTVGKGISKAEVHKIFKAYAKVHKAKKPTEIVESLQVAL